MFQQPAGRISAVDCDALELRPHSAGCGFLLTEAVFREVRHNGHRGAPSPAVCLFCRFLRKRPCVFRCYGLSKVTISTRSATVEAALGASPARRPLLEWEIGRAHV